MTKMKTKRAAAKRFSFTGSGKIKRNHANHRHLLTNKPKDAKLRTRGTGLVSEADAGLIKLMMPYR